MTAHVSTLNRCFGLAIALMLGACGSVMETDKVNYKSQSDENKAAPLEVPPDLTKMSRNKRYEMPAGSVSAKAIGAGPHEFTLRSTSQRRQDVASGTRWHESMVSLETPMRFWGKRGLDADLEDKTQAYAELSYADALHEGGRELIQLWFAYLSALADEHNAQTALTLSAKMQRMTQVQLKQGEVSKLDAELASAELERTQAALAVAQAQRSGAAAVLQRRFPSLSLPSAEVLSATTTMLAYSIEYVEAQSHPKDRAHNRQALMTALQTLLLRVTPSTPTM